MMAIGNYLVLQDFTYKDQLYEISQELHLPDNIAEHYVRQGILRLLTFLEPGTDDAAIAVVETEVGEDHEQAAAADLARDQAQSAEMIAGDAAAAEGP